MPAGEKRPSKVNCKRLHGGEYEVDVEKLRFRPAAYGLAVNDGKVLLGRSAFTDLWDIPGGAIERGETVEQGLIREFYEETGVKPTPVEILTVRDGFISIWGHPFQSIRLYYRVDVPQTTSFESLSPHEIFDLQWVDPQLEPPEEFAEGDLAVIEQALAASGGV